MLHLAGGEDQGAGDGQEVGAPVAVPSAVAYSTLTSLPLGAERVTVKATAFAPVSPSETVRSDTDRVGGGVGWKTARYVVGVSGAVRLWLWPRPSDHESKP